MIKVLIISYIPILREGLRALLRPEKDLEISTLSRSSARPLVEDVLISSPDVVLVDAEVLEREGWLFLNDLRRVAPQIATLVLSDTPTDRRSSNALALGAHGYLLREASAGQMAASIRAAQQDLYILHPQAAETLVAALHSTSLDSVQMEDGDTDSYEPLIEPLTERELNVLRLVTRGMANKQIATELFITEHTVKFHIRSILSKLGAANRTEAVTLSLQRGLVTL